MARPLRLEYPGSLWHVTVRGNERRDIYRDDLDRQLFLELLAEAVERFGWMLTAYVLMSNHFHLVLELTTTTLSRGMHWLDCRYAQTFNRRHGRVGHLYQGRFGSSLIEKEGYLQTVLRYVVLNPVRANMVGHPGDYVWSSYRSTVGDAPAPDWLAVDEVLIQFAEERSIAQLRYRAYVEEGMEIATSPWTSLVGQMYLGTETWIEGIRDRVKSRVRDYEHPAAQREIGNPPMASVIRSVADGLGIDESKVRQGRGGVPRMLAAWLGSRESLLTLPSIAAGLRLRSPGYVSTLVDQCDRELMQNPVLQASLDRCIRMLRGVEKTIEPKI